MDSWNGEDGFPDQFPAGIRVLAVDDDPASLRILENLLRICKYEVTTTDEAYSALKILKENRNKYDLVISDVDMPGMDGFKFLELVSLEMNLPVIMLSAHGGYEFVMKGITLGACDYLLKPVRQEELKIIWQHIVRKKKLNFIKSKSNSENSKKENDRRSQDDEKEEEEKEEESEEDNEDSCGGQKKPRVVWTSELHQKFVDAVNQLGLEKAVPKKILDLMDIEGLTRENVASHLQKFRLYLKKLNDEADQKNNSNFHMGHFDDFRDFQSLSNTRQLFSSSLSSYPLFGSPSNFTGISSSRFIQPSNYPNLINSANPPGFSFGSTNTVVGSCSGSFGLSNPLMNHQQTHESVLHGNQSSFHVPLNTGSLDGNLCSTSDFIGTARCKESWIETDKLASFSSSPLMMFQNVSKPDDNREDHNNVLKNSFRTMENMVSTSSVMVGHSNNEMVYNPLHTELEKAALVRPEKMADGDILFEQTRPSDGFITNSHDALDDIMKEMMKQGGNGMMSMADDLGFDAFATGPFASDT